MTKKYQIRLLPTAQKSLKRIHPEIQRRLTTTLKLLAQNPRPPKSKNLAGPHPLLRVRVGDYRIIYAVEDEVLVVVVIALGHRRDVYRGLGD